MLVLAFLAACGAGAQAASLSGSFSDIPAGSAVDLTLAGPADWVHWGYSNPYDLTRKNSVPPQISDYTLLIPTSAYVEPFAYADNANGYSWSDGTEPASVLNSTTGVYAYSTPPTEGVGFEISAPADTQPRQLKIYVGVYSGQGQLSATLSDNSAAGYTNSSLSYSGNGLSRVYTLNYAANSGGQKLHVRWLLSKRQGGATQIPNVTLQAAALATPGIDVPPGIRLMSITNGSQFAVGQPILLEAAAADVDGVITNVQFFADAASVGSVTQASFTLVWTNALPGLHRITAVATDDNGSSTTSDSVEIGVYSSGGLLAGAFTQPAPAWVDVSTEGSVDWMHWGLTANNSLDRQARSTPVLTNCLLGTNSPLGVTDSSTVWYWTNGTPTLLNPGSTSGTLLYGLGSGYDLIVPASPSPQKLRLYAGLYGSHVHFRAYLTDFSAPAFYDGSLSEVYSTVSGVYELEFASATPGQQLCVRYETQQLFDPGYGNLRWMTATLGPGDAVLPVSLRNPALLGNLFVFSLYTTWNRTYTVEYADSLPATSWTPAGSFIGTGQLQSVTNIINNPGPAFFRVRAE